MTNFALIGASGFVAPRHLQAVKDLGGALVAAVDPNDSAGVLDRYFPDVRFFTEIERFDRFLEKLRPRRRAKIELSYVTRRGPWYHVSWKGDAEKSGGVEMNIGIHFFAPTALCSWTEKRSISPRAWGIRTQWSIKTSPQAATGNALKTGNFGYFLGSARRLRGRHLAIAWTHVQRRLGLGRRRS